MVKLRAVLIASLPLLLPQAAPAQIGPVPAPPGIGPLDRRAPVDMHRLPWSALVRVQTELGERCTGFAIAPRLVVTAAHCLFLPRVGRFIDPPSVHVLLDYDAGRYARHRRAVRVLIPEGYRPRDEDRTAGLDRAILVLDGPLLAASAALPIATPPDGVPFPVLLGGYGQDRDEVAIATPGCQVVGMAADGNGRPLLVHDCQATRGTSGAPLVRQGPDGRWAAIGIQIEAAPMAGGRAVPLTGPATPRGSSAGR